MNLGSEFWQFARKEQTQLTGVSTRAATTQFQVGEVHSDLLHFRTNAICRVTRLRDGARFVLQVQMAERSGAEIQSELRWLDALGEDGLPVPQARPAADGERMIRAGGRDCTLLTWATGRRAGKRPTPEQVRRIGREMARLHAHAARLEVPEWFAPPRWDPKTLVNGVGWQRLNPEQAELFRRVAGRFVLAAAELGYGSDVFGLIHGDFTFENVLFDRGELRVIDFDDCGCGYYLYDIAALLDRMEWRDNYRELRAALLEGYREERWLAPEQEQFLDLFLLLRWVFLGLAFVSAPEGLPGRRYTPCFLEIVVPKMRTIAPDGSPNAPVEQGFVVALMTQPANLSSKQGRRIRWNASTRQVGA